jgi:hypothetical protein
VGNVANAVGEKGHPGEFYLVGAPKPTPRALHTLRGDDAGDSTLALRGLSLRGGEPCR